MDYNAQVQALTNKYNQARQQTQGNINATNDDINALGTQYNTNQQGLNQQQAQANQGFYTQKNTAAVNNAQTSNKITDWMAANGVANSGENQSAQQQQANNNENTMGGIQNDQNNSNTNFQNKIQDLTNQYNMQHQAKINALTQLRQQLAGYDTTQNDDMQSLKNSYAASQASASAQAAKEQATNYQNAIADMMAKQAKGVPLTTWLQAPSNINGLEQLTPEQKASLMQGGAIYQRLLKDPTGQVL